MMQLIRDRAQGLVVWTIVGLIIMTFAVVGLGSYLSGTANNAVASVDGNEISQNEFQRAYRNYQDRLQQMLGTSYRSDLFKPAMLKQEVINGLVNQRLLSQYLEDEKIYPADQLIAEEIHNIPAFKDEQGQFSNERYQELVGRQGLSPAGFEANLARDIAGQQVSTALSKTAFVTSKEIAAYQRLKHQQRDMGYLLLEKSAYLGKVIPGDEEVEKYYQANLNQFMTQEKIKLNYVELDLTKRSANISIDDAKVKEQYQTNQNAYLKEAEQRKASHILIKVNKDTDDEAAKKKLSAILADYKAGTPFSELAKQNSQDPGSAKQGGDLGFFGKGAMDKAFEDTAFNLGKGDISQPVKSRFGYHLILLTDVKPAEHRSYEEVKNQIRKELQMESAEQDFYVDAEKLDNLSYDAPESLNAIVDELGLQQQQSELMGRQGGRGILSNPKIIEVAFSDEVLNQGRNSAVIEISNTHLVVVRLAEHKPAIQRPLSEVKPVITKRLQTQTAQDQAAKDAQAVLGIIKAGGKATEWSNQNRKGRWNTIGFIGREAKFDPVKDKAVELSAEIRQKLFTMPHPKDEQAVADTMTLQNGDTAVLLLYKIKDAVIDKTVTSQYKQQLQSAMGSADYNFFIQDLREKADISIQIENTEDQQ